MGENHKFNVNTYFPKTNTHSAQKTSISASKILRKVVVELLFLITSWNSIFSLVTYPENKTKQTPRMNKQNPKPSPLPQKNLTQNRTQNKPKQTNSNEKEAIIAEKFHGNKNLLKRQRDILKAKDKPEVLLLHNHFSRKIIFTLFIRL